MQNKTFSPQRLLYLVVLVMQWRLESSLGGRGRVSAAAGVVQGGGGGGLTRVKRGGGEVGG